MTKTSYFLKSAFNGTKYCCSVSVNYNYHNWSFSAWSICSFFPSFLAFFPSFLHHYFWNVIVLCPFVLFVEIIYWSDVIFSKWIYICIIIVISRLQCCLSLYHFRLISFLIILKIIIYFFNIRNQNLLLLMNWLF